MPNHVINEVTLHGVSLARAKPLIESDGCEIDFEVAVPLPVNFWPGNVGDRHKEAFPGTHLDAASKTWGTKWNAYGLNEGGKYESVREVDGSTLLTFQSAWSHPRGWTVALFNLLKCDITAKWLSEGGWAGHIEEYRFEGLEDMSIDAWTDTEIEDGSEEHRHLHKLLWGVEEFDDEDET